jgi:WD40 repeat protein
MTIKSIETHISTDHEYFVVEFKGLHLRPLFKNPSPCLCTKTYDFKSGLGTENIQLSSDLVSVNESMDKYFPNKNKGKSLMFSPDGNTIFGITNNQNITQWDINTKEEIRTFGNNESNIITIAIHPEGKILASSYQDKTVKFWYIPTVREIHSIDEEVRVMSFSQDGETFATLNNETAKLWRSL